MTNKEWLNSLSNEKLLSAIETNCNICIYKNGECNLEDSTCKQGMNAWLEEEHEEEYEEELPLCPFKCEGCAREVEVECAGAYWISPISFSPATYCFLQEDMFDTKEEAIEAWKKAVSK